MSCNEEERQSKRVRVETFVDSFLTGLRATTSNANVQSSIDQTRAELCSGLTTSAQAIKEARRQLGKNDESYLQLSVMVLWSGEGSDETHLLYPASANTERDLNESTLRSMARVAEDDYKQILKQLEIAENHFAYYLAIPEIRVWLFSFAMKENLDWYVTKIETILVSRKESYDPDDPFELLRNERYNEMPMWLDFIHEAVADDVQVSHLFNAFSLISDPYQEVILNGLFCVKPDTLKACYDEHEGECDELAILSNTQLESRYQDTQFAEDNTNATFDIASTVQPMDFNGSFVFFDDTLDYCKTKSLPVFPMVGLDNFKDLIQSTRLIDWIREERVSIDSNRMSEQKLIELCSGQTQLRAFSSCFLSISRGVTCSVPPHFLVQDVEDSYSLPVMDNTTSLALSSLNEIGLDVQWSQPGKIISMWQSVYEYDKLLKLDSTKMKEANPYLKCLWTPTVVKPRVRSSTPTIGNVAINEASLATSYCTMLSELHKSFNSNVPDKIEASRFVEAVCKLEMLSSLRILNRHNANSIQSLISSDGMYDSPDVNLVWFHSIQPNLVAKQTGVATLQQLEQCYSLVSTTSNIPNCDQEWDTFAVPTVPNSYDVIPQFGEDDISYRSTTNLVPEFASMNDVRTCVDLLYRWKYNSDARARLEHIKTRVGVLKESYQELLERGRREYSGVKPKSDVEERERRNVIWSDSLRELDVSGDRFYRFLKDVAGTLHEDVTSLIDLEDRSMEQNQRIYREQRRETLRQINSFSQRVMDTVISSVFRQSKMRADIDAMPVKKSSNSPESSAAAGAADNMIDSVVVVSEESVQKVRELADGTSGLGFLEANQALQQFLVSQQAKPLSLRELLIGMRGVLNTYRDYAIDSLQTNQMQSGRASLEYLANPRNSYVVRIKNETFAAIRSAYLLLRRQLLDTGFSHSKLPSAYECIEGDYYEVCNQFAQLVAYQLGHSRAFSSAASVYLGATPAKMNLAMLNISLNKTCNRVRQMVSNARL